jgi:Flp pilus assembly protein TadD
VIEAATLPPDELARRVAAEYRDAVAANPNDARLRLRLGQALIAAGRADEAEKTFRELLGMKPAADVARDAGNALVAEAKYGLAAEFLREATAGNPEAWVDLAVAEFFANGPNAAVKALEAAPRDTATGDYKVMRALVLEAAGKSDAALAEMRASAGRAVERPRVAEEGALLLARHGETERALEMLDRAIRSAPGERSLRLSRVAVLAGAGKVKEAKTAAREMENRWPEWDRAWLAEAMLLVREGRKEEAKGRMAMAEALGAKDEVVACVKERAAGSEGKCGCDAGVWGVIAGCKGK